MPASFILSLSNTTISLRKVDIIQRLGVTLVPVYFDVEKPRCVTNFFLSRKKKTT